MSLEHGATVTEMGAELRILSIPSLPAARISTWLSLVEIRHICSQLSLSEVMAVASELLTSTGKAYQDTTSS